MLALLPIPTFNGAAACKGSYRLWDDVTASLEQLRCLDPDGVRHNPQRVAEVAADCAPYCWSCPIRRECLDWAEEERFTGVAGGAVLHHGHLSAWLPAPSQEVSHPRASVVA